MTTEKVKEILDDVFGVYYSEYMGQGDYNVDEAQEALDTALNALDKVEKLQKALENISDVLIVSFNSELKDGSGLCVARKYGETIFTLKMELGEQADILYRLLTEQTLKAEIKAGSEVSE